MIELFAAAALALPGDSSVVFQGREGELRVTPPRMESVSIAVDGRLAEPVWERAAVLTGFTQYEPTEGIPATQETEVRVLYTDDAIYFGVRALDTRPERIRATVAERDRSIFDDDWVRLMLDTYNRQRQAYILYVNPKGIQTDGLWIEGLQRGGRGGPRIPIDFNPDFIWQSDGRVGEDGWTAEIRIPYISLSFPQDSVQTWGLNVAREVKRFGYKQSWAPLTQAQSSTLAQNGHLVGLRGLEPRRLREVTPVVTGKWSGERSGGEFVRGDPDPQFGVNARYALAQNLKLGATFNPDFSQVEADAERVTVNERFALFFPEKRPFFLEGTEVFNTPQRLVHTRRVVDPVGGAKITGRLGSVDVGYLGAVDEAPVTFGDARHEAAFNLFRLKKDVGRNSHAGFLYADRSSLGGATYNRVAAADARLVSGRYSLTAQTGASWTGDRDQEDPGFGHILSLRGERSGREFSWQVEFGDVAPDFRAGTGLIRRIGDAQLSGQVERNFFTEPGSFVERLGLELRTQSFFDHEELWDLRSPFEWEVELQPSVAIRGGSFLGVTFRNGHFRFRPEDYAGYRVEAPDGSLEEFRVPDPLGGMLAAGGFSRFRMSEAVRGGGRLFLRQTPIFTEASLGKELLFRPDLNLQPSDRLSLELSYTLSRLWREEDGSLFSTADLPRVKTQYMFSRDLFARVVLQYGLQQRDALRDPRSGRPLWVGGRRATAREEGSFLAQLLLSYEPSPGTVFFVGYSRQEEGDRTLSLSRLQPISDGFFVKASYLKRF